MEKLNLDNNNLKKFGITMGTAFLAIALFILIRHRQGTWPVAAISLAFFLLAFGIPALLEPIYIIWMRLAFILGWINTRLILMIMFYLVFTPVGLVMKLFGMDLLDRKIQREKDSYWVESRQKIFNRLDYERQF